jgi:CheY-like chemotaxis protein
MLDAQENITMLTTTTTKITGPPKPRVMVAEDNTTLRRLVEMSLRTREVDLLIVENGQQAVDAASNNEFDLILMDLHMPVMDGFEATQAIRKFEESGDRRTTIVAVSCDDERMNRCHEIGMDGYEKKPANYFQVLRTPALV